MLLELAQWLAKDVRLFNVFNYITLRAVLACLTALAVSLILGPYFIRKLTAYKIGQAVRDDGPRTHLTKAGTPTMGGALILVSIGITTLLWGDLSNRLLWVVLLVTVAFGAVGWVDDYRKVVHRNPKGLSAKESIAEINPYVEVVLHEERLDNDNVMDVFRGYDLIVDGTDNFATRYMVNDAAYFLGIPYVWGSIYRFDGQASVFAPTLVDDAPCYRCLYPEPPPPGMVPSCAEGGVLGVLCASIGSIQVNEAIKLLTGIGDPLVGKLMIYDALEMEYRKLKVRKDPNCALCGENPTVTELIDYETFCGAISEDAADAAAGSTISVVQLEHMLKERAEGARDFVLVDVREPNEYEINQIPGSVLIPKGEFLNGNALSQLPADKQVVLHCKSGVRSAEALAVVKGAGYADAVHVGGGVVAWVNQIDPSQPSY